MKRDLTLPLCLLGLAAILICASDLHSAISASTPPAPPVPWAQTSRTFFDGIALIRQSQEPRACAPDYDGRLSMTAQAQICICDGSAKQWKLANTDKPCTWKATP